MNFMVCEHFTDKTFETTGCTWTYLPNSNLSWKKKTSCHGIFKWIAILKAQSRSYNCIPSYFWMIEKRHYVKTRRVDTWHMECDTQEVVSIASNSQVPSPDSLPVWEWCHVTRDMWHVTNDKQGIVNIGSKFQVYSSIVLGVMMFQSFGGKGRVSQSVSQF